MEENHHELEDFVSRRLISRADLTDEQTMKQDDKAMPTLEREGDDSTTTNDPHTETDGEAGTSITPVTADVEMVGKGRGVRVEKSLISIGFFTPSSRRIKDQKVKRITFTRTVGGKRVEAAAEFHPSAMFGLPVTADLDKYIALMDMIADIIRTKGKISNPIRFTSAELLRHLNKRVKTGKNYKAVGEWLDVMTGTLIKSDGVVYQVGKGGKPGKFAIDRFHVFERAATFGQMLPDGTIADANYVWLSEWQLDNINEKFVMPVDFATYRKLKNHIAKILVTLLQVWLFASEKAGSFEKRYDELCQMLSLQVYRTPSEITRQLKPSLDELTGYGYLTEWRIEKTSDRKSYKIVFVHGPKFFQDRRKRIKNETSEPPLIIARSEPAEPSLPEPAVEAAAPATTRTKESREGKVVSTPFFKAMNEAGAVTQESQPGELNAEPTMLDELVSRGLMASAAMNLLNSLAAERLERVPDYIEYWDSVKAKSTKEVGAGLLYELIRKGDPLPTSFLTKRRREEQRIAEEHRNRIAMAKQSLDLAYERYQEETVDHFVAEFPKKEYDRIYENYNQEMSKQGSFFADKHESKLFQMLVESAVRAELRKRINFMSFDEFSRHNAREILGHSNIDPAELGIVVVPMQPNVPSTSAPHHEAIEADRNHGISGAESAT